MPLFLKKELLPLVFLREICRRHDKGPCVAKGYAGGARLAAIGGSSSKTGRDLVNCVSPVWGLMIMLN